MLTQTQIKKLESLTKHPKYGALVKRALMNWKKCKPVTCDHGIEEINGKFKRTSYYDGCCFTGAGLLGLKGFDIRETLKQKFNIFDEESIRLEFGFDAWDSKLEYTDNPIYKEAYNFGKKVGKIVKPE